MTEVSFSECVINTMNDYEKKMTENVFYRWIDEYCNRKIDSGLDRREQFEWDFEDYIFKAKPPEFTESKSSKNVNKVKQLLETAQRKYDFWSNASKLTLQSMLLLFSKNKNSNEVIEYLHSLKVEKYQNLLPNDDKLTDEQKVEKRKELALAAKDFADHFWLKKPLIRGLYFKGLHGEGRGGEQFYKYNHKSLKKNRNNHQPPDTFFIERALNTKGKFFRGKKLQKSGIISANDVKTEVKNISSLKKDVNIRLDTPKYTKKGWFKYIEFMATPEIIEYLQEYAKGGYGLSKILDDYERINHNLRIKMIRFKDRRDWSRKSITTLCPPKPETTGIQLKF